MNDLSNICPRLQTAHYVATIADKKHSRDHASVTGECVCGASELAGFFIFDINSIIMHIAKP